MKRHWKIVSILLFLIMVVIVIITICNSRNQLQQAVKKLDSAKVVLDSASAHVDNSKKVVQDLKSDLKSYSDRLNEINSYANTLAKQRVSNKTIFINQANKDSAKFEELKKEVMKYMKDYWPEISVDTAKQIQP